MKRFRELTIGDPVWLVLGGGDELEIYKHKIESISGGSDMSGKFVWFLGISGRLSMTIPDELYMSGTHSYCGDYICFPDTGWVEELISSVEDKFLARLIREGRPVGEILDTMEQHFLPLYETLYRS